MAEVKFADVAASFADDLSPSGFYAKSDKSSYYSSGRSFHDGSVERSSSSPPSIRGPPSRVAPRTLSMMAAPRQRTNDRTQLIGPNHNPSPSKLLPSKQLPNAMDENEQAKLARENIVISPSMDYKTVIENVKHHVRTQQGRELCRVYGNSRSAKHKCTSPTCEMAVVMSKNSKRNEWILSPKSKWAHSESCGSKAKASMSLAKHPQVIENLKSYDSAKDVNKRAVAKFISSNFEDMTFGVPNKNTSCAKRMCVNRVVDRVWQRDASGIISQMSKLRGWCDAFQATLYNGWAAMETRYDTMHGTLFDGLFGRC